MSVENEKEIARASRWAAVSLNGSPRSLEARLRAILSARLRRVWALKRRQIAGGLLTAGLLMLPIAALRTAQQRHRDYVAPPCAPTATPAQIAAAKPDDYVCGPNGSYTQAARLHPLPYDVIPDDARWTRALPDGVSIELVGLAEAKTPRGYQPEEAKRKGKLQWSYWRPDGTPLMQPLFLYASSPAEYMHDGLEASRYFALAFRIRPDTARQVDFTVKVPDASMTSLDGIAYSNGVEDSPREAWQKGGFRVLQTTLPAKTRRTNIRLGAVVGAPFTLAVVPLKTRSSSVERGGVNATFRNAMLHLKALEEKGRLRLNVKSNQALSDTLSLRYVAVDQQGKTYDSYSSSTGSRTETPPGSSVPTVDFTADAYWDAKHLPPGGISGVKEIRITGRDYRWFRFDNIALRPKSR